MTGEIRRIRQISYSSPFQAPVEGRKLLTAKFVYYQPGSRSNRDEESRQQPKLLVTFTDK
jgi:hypothetical protein